MKRKEYTVIHLLGDVAAIDRVGENAGKTRISRIAKITPPRVSRVVTSAISLGLIYAYTDKYRKNITRVCYSLTGTGQEILNVHNGHKNKTFWELSGE